MRKVLVNWECRRKYELTHSSIDIDEQIQVLFLLAPTGVLSPEELVILTRLKNCKENILELEASFWRLKNEAVWIAMGDANTIFFSRNMPVSQKYEYHLALS